MNMQVDAKCLSSQRRPSNTASKRPFRLLSIFQLVFSNRLSQLFEFGFAFANGLSIHRTTVSLFLIFFEMVFQPVRRYLRDII